MVTKGTGTSRPDPRIAFFNDLAPTWDSEGPSADQVIARLDACRDLLGLRPGQDVLEVGCGTGKTTAWLVAQVTPGRVTAVDFAPGMIEMARAKGIDADFLCLDVCCQGLQPKRFDLVFCFHCFPHFRDQDAALRKLGGCLAPGGRLIVMHLAGSEQINRFHAGLNSCVRDDVLPPLDHWPDILARVGLRLVRQIDRDDLFLVEAGRL